MDRRQPTTPKKANSCSCGAATSVGIVKSGESWLDQERLYHERGPMPSHHLRCKHCTSVWVHGCVPRWMPLYGPDPTTGVDLWPMSASLPATSPFLCGCSLVPSLWVENESTSEALVLWYSSMYRKEARRECTMFCRLSGVFWNKRRCYMPITWCQNSLGCLRCV